MRRTQLVLIIGEAQWGSKNYPDASTQKKREFCTSKWRVKQWKIRVTVCSKSLWRKCVIAAKFVLTVTLSSRQCDMSDLFITLWVHHPLVFFVLSNGLNFFFKLLAWVYTGSASMFSEAIHSLADTCNQALLALGISQSVRNPDAVHP